MADSPDGPWQLAREVPEAVYAIPPSSPVYNATYVRVYETEPDAVWYGYTMGYLFGFPAWGTYVYGTGWAYPPYWYNWPGYAYPIYYPRPVTWGLGAYYNPVRGAFGRYGYAYGPYRGIAGVRSWNPRTGTYVRGGAAWGPRGSAGFVGAYNPRSDRAGYIAGGRNVYGAWKSAGVKRGSEWARVTARANAAGGSTLRWNTSTGQGFVHEGRRGDIYAGRDGNVYRNTGDGWQTFDGGWQDVARPERGELLERGEGLRDLSPEARERLQERGGGEALRGLAGAGAAGAAGAALGQRLSGGEQARRDRAEGGIGDGRRAGGSTSVRSSSARGAAAVGSAGPCKRRQRPAQQRPGARSVRSAAASRGKGAPCGTTASGGPASCATCASPATPSNVATPRPATREPAPDREPTVRSTLTAVLASDGLLLTPAEHGAAGWFWRRQHWRRRLWRRARRLWRPRRWPPLVSYLCGEVTPTVPMAQTVKHAVPPWANLTRELSFVRQVWQPSRPSRYRQRDLRLAGVKAELKTTKGECGAACLPSPHIMKGRTQS